MADVSNLIRKAVDVLQSIYLYSFEPAPEAIRGIALVGPLASGKTTLANTIRQSHLIQSGRVIVPKLYVSGVPMPDNIFDGDELVPYGAFVEKAARGEIELYWERKFEDGRTEAYGFEALQNPNAFVVYSGNVALYESRNSVRPAESLDGILFVGVEAPFNVRERRLCQRSPDLISAKPKEIEYRLAESMPQVPVVVRNYEGYATLAPQQIVTFVERLVQLNE